MTLTQPLGIKWIVGLLLIVFLQSCSKYSINLSPNYIKQYDLEFAKYCNLDTSVNFESNAVLSNFYGDYSMSIWLASKDERTRSSNANVNSVAIKDIAGTLQTIIDDSNSTISERNNAERFLLMINPASLDKTFASAKKLDADSLIVKLSKNYHFLLINEAHYSSQNRAFTHSLLKPLWEIGYKYLALEALGYDDTLLVERGTPIVNTGYYLRDPVFSAMVRDAIKIGFKLVPYESRGDFQGTLRDKEQAANIYSQTFKKDTVGKVLIHAGYSHIAEDGDSSYLPMGAQLKHLVNQDLLTVDQVNMVGVNPDRLHPSYAYAKNNFTFNKPTVFINSDEKIIVDPVNKASIDVQVYHPFTVFKYERPTWLLFDPRSRFVNIASALRNYKGHLLQVLNPGAGKTEIPIDHIVINDHKALILKPGDYMIRIINRQGDLVQVGSLKIK
ncbi:MAG TPA: hypothetical protein VNI52_01665 [Sphingobacteriaceae bacterium]|nr:hypothetical protein [Sphingobacteriaceae bacterium]